MADAFDPNHVNLTEASAVDIICYLNRGENEYDGRMGARVSAIFVILVTSALTTFFPVVATRIRGLRIPLYAYLFARYFGAGVIIATAFIHLLDPAYKEIGPNTCVGMTGGWASYSWPPCLALAMVMLTFLLEFGAEWYVEQTYGLPHGEHDHVEDAITIRAAATDSAVDSAAAAAAAARPHQPHQHLHSADQDHSSSDAGHGHGHARHKGALLDDVKLKPTASVSTDGARAFHEQFAAFLVLEFGVLFHSVIIGLNLGVVGDEFETLYPVLVFHQAFEGLGIGARLSAIPFPARAGRFVRALPWLLCLAYSLATPIAIAIGLGVRTTYNSGSFTASIVSGVLDSISAGILLYTGLVELLARDFLFNPERSRDGKRILFMLVSLFLGTGIMALLGKWA